MIVWANANTGQRLDKKAGRLPMRAYIGPAKNLPLNDRETPSKTEDTVLLAGIFRFSGKRVIGGELGGFIYAFAEITDVMSRKPKSKGADPSFTM